MKKREQLTSEDYFAAARTAETIRQSTNRDAMIADLRNRGERELRKEIASLFTTPRKARRML